MPIEAAGRRSAGLFRILGRRCHACGAVAGRGAGRHGLPPLCARCAEALAPREGGWCPSCGAVAADPGAVPTVCGECRRNPPPWDSFFFYGAYEGLLRSLLSQYKFHGRLGLGRLMQSLVLEAWRLRRGGEPVPDVLVPVPLHPRRLSWRGFNQSLEILRLLARGLDVPPAPEALVRVRHTVPQMELSAGERRDNVRGAFRADGGLVRGRGVLLVDDIMTTGGTMRECVGCLLRAGAVRVDVLVVARTVRDG